MSEREKLLSELAEARLTIEKLEKTNALLKKRALNAIIGKRVVADCEAERRACEAGRSLAEHASRVKSSFLENISHELRSSMNGVVGMIDLVLATELGRSQQDYLEMAKTSVDRLMAAFTEILDFSRIETGELEPVNKEFALKESLDHDLYIQSMAAAQKGLELTCSIDANVPERLYGDSQRLQQIVTNLVSNGIKFTDSGAVEIIITNEGYDTNNNMYLRFSVRDTGTAMTAETAALIKEHFAKELQPSQPHFLFLESGGLGLTVTSQLVKLLGGEIGMDSGAAGSTFWFTLPYKESAEVRALEAAASATLLNIKEEPSYSLRGAKILLAEDDYINRKLVETVLHQLEVEVTSVDNGREAVETACRNDYQLILMDVQMDDVDGLEAARQIRAYEKKHGRRTPIIALTALALAGDRERCLQAGMDDYLTKPLRRVDIAAKLSDHLAKTALVVETEPASRDFLVRHLVESGWRVTIAETRKQAMYEICLSHFDLIFSAIDGDGEDFMETVGVIRKLESFNGWRTQVIGLFGHSNENIDAGIDLDGYLKRPITLEKITQVLEPVAVTG